jgi:hypothetical protein
MWASSSTSLADPEAQVAAGGVAEVRARALRADDGSELAIARFEAAGYDAERDEAISRALAALEPQLAANLGLQLERNWQAQTPGERPVELELEAVSSLAQVDAVRRAILTTLAAKNAEIRARGGTATLRVVSSLPPAACRSGSRLHFEASPSPGRGRGRARDFASRLPFRPGRLAPGRGKIDAPGRN